MSRVKKLKYHALSKQFFSIYKYLKVVNFEETFHWEHFFAVEDVNNFHPMLKNSKYCDHITWDWDMNTYPSPTFLPILVVIVINVRTANFK